MGSTPLESDINRIGQNYKELNYNTVTIKVSVDPIKSPAAGTALQSYPALSKSDQDFISPCQ